jgi:hypothetical protein
LAASCKTEYLQAVTVATTDLKAAAGQTLPTEQAQVTDMLTVWRRVHIEVDSMGPVTGNNVAGNITRAHSNKQSNRTVLTVSPTLDAGRFENGRIVITGIGSFDITDSNRNSITIIGQVPDAADHSFVAYDDDDFNDDDSDMNGVRFDGDEGEDVPGPDTSLLQDSDDPTLNAFAPAYVRPAYDVGITTARRPSC